MEERAMQAEPFDPASDSSASDGYVDYTNISKSEYKEWERQEKVKNEAKSAKHNGKITKPLLFPDSDDEDYIYSDDEEEEVAVKGEVSEVSPVSPKKRGYAVLEEEVPEVSPKKRGRPCKADGSMPISRSGKSTIKAEVNDFDDDSNKHNKISMMMVPIKVERGYEPVAPVAVGAKMESKEEKRAKIKARFQQNPPQYTNHPETFTMYVLEAPDSDFFVVVAGLLNNKSKQPSVFLRPGFLLEGLHSVAELDDESPAVERFRYAWASCVKITLRKIEHGDNESAYHEYQKTTYFHDAVLFLAKKDAFRGKETIRMFEQCMKEILRSDMFFETIAELTTHVGQTGVSIQAMQDDTSAVWKYLKNPSTMTIVRMEHLDQLLLDDDIVCMLKNIYGPEKWKEYGHVGWKSRKGCFKGRTPCRP